MATSAAEMIDRLFVLHIRRFGFRIITYLESYSIFVASTINILDLKDGIDKEGARARLALGLEVLRNATGSQSGTECITSTPNISRCIEIIEKLLQKNETSNEEDQPRQTRDPGSSGSLHEASAGASAGTSSNHRQSPSMWTAPAPAAAPATDHQPNSHFRTHFHAHNPHCSTASLSSTMTRVSDVPDFQQFTAPGMSGRADLLPFYHSEWPFFNNGLAFFGNEPALFDSSSALPGPMPGQDPNPGMHGSTLDNGLVDRANI